MSLPFHSVPRRKIPVVARARISPDGSERLARATDTSVRSQSIDCAFSSPRFLGFPLARALDRSCPVFHAKGDYIYIYIFLFYTHVPPRLVTYTRCPVTSITNGWVLTVARSSSVRLESPVYRDDRRQADDHQVRRSRHKAPVLFHALTCKQKTSMPVLIKIKIQSKGVKRARRLIRARLSTSCHSTFVRWSRLRVAANCAWLSRTIWLSEFNRRRASDDNCRRDDFDWTLQSVALSNRLPLPLPPAARKKHIASSRRAASLFPRQPRTLSSNLANFDTYFHTKSREGTNRSH